MPEHAHRRRSDSTPHSLEVESWSPSPFLSDSKALSTDMTTDSSEECGGKGIELSSENKAHERSRECSSRSCLFMGHG